MSTNLIKKISPKTVCGDIKKIVANVADKDGQFKPFTLYTVFGVAIGIQTGSSDMGEWMAFKGDFEAHNADTGEIFRAPKCFINEPAQSMIEAALAENDTVEMAFDVKVAPDNNAYGYTYTVAPRIQPQENDAISLLRQKVFALEDKSESSKKPAKK